VRKDGQPFTVGQPWEPEQLTIFPVRSLKTSKILRDRGIRVIAATFPELKPSNPAVRQQLLDYWRAQWQRDESKKLAPYDYEEVKVRAAARVHAQDDMVKSLSEVLKDSTISRDMVVLRLFQSLETFAKEPSTRKMLPAETVHMLGNLQQWLGLAKLPPPELPGDHGPGPDE